MVRPIIHSVKHQVQLPFDAILTGVRQNNVLVDAVNAPDANLAFEVPEGTVIKAVFIEMWTQNTSSAGHEVIILEKCSQDQGGASFAEMASLFTYNNKKNIFFTHEGLTSNDGIANPLPVMSGWYKVPKSKQRFGLGDSLILTISNPSSNSLNRCGIAIYKGYS